MLSTTSDTRDRWAQWLLERRFGGDPKRTESTMRFLAPVRERVLDNAQLREGDVVLDAGAGDGLIAFGALERVGESGRVIFSDVSQDLLDHSRALAEELGVADRCEFVLASAEDLAPIADASVDVVTTRSVVIYLPFEAKQRSFQAFFRVLRAGGRISIFEPINRFGYCDTDDEFWGFDARPVRELTRKVRAAYEEQAAGEKTLIDFDERDLLAFAERAGFHEIELDLNSKIERDAALGWGWDDDGFDWDAFMNISGNPHAPTLAEILEDALTQEERNRFVAYMRPQFEGRKAIARSSVAYLRAVKR